MGIVMVKCPDTGHEIATGIVADRASFASTPVFFARVYCPACRTEHEWFAQEAWVRESEPPRLECVALS
jgi:ribosomal protein S27E